MVLLFYTNYISVALAHHEIFRAKIGKGGIILRSWNANMGIKMECRFSIQKGSYKVWEINMGVCPHLDFDDTSIKLFIAWCMNSLFIVHLIFYAIPLSINCVMYDITTAPEGTIL